ncbi:cytochrome P450 [Amycolatopsis sp. CA-230715]|uniref:cytochrome P450 n=1 Tax=Amycolatopsis sp. CA-230715 TaxID=2745196 RepID=UPI001C015FFB|nr:cytochrome P450 [Amycolatopsis sp. CA-230715]QWF83963.1 Cytochrome P450 107B1 [Amycolatopsis sp. CA-230715]
MTETAAPGLQALFDPAHRADPYPAYRHWREDAPVANPMPGLVVVTRHADCAAVLRDSRFGHAEPDEPNPLRPTPPTDPETALVDENGNPVRSFLGLNPPDHTRLRKLVSRAFTRPMVARLAPRIEQLTAELLDGFGTGTVDLIDSLAYPLPVAVISELLDIPHADRDQFVAWSHSLARGLDPDFALPPGTREKLVRTRGEFAEYIRGLAAVRRADPGEDLLSALVEVHDSGDGLTENELLATCILLLIAGHETTVNLIGNGTLALLRAPDQLAALRAEPELVDQAVEELLRYDSPVQLTMRAALEDAEIGGFAMPRGSVAILVIGSANRDPEAFTDPDRLDVRREPTRHLAFGQGIHFCLGAPLARLEARIAFQALLARFPDLRLAAEPSWKDNLILRGLATLPVHTG